LDEESTVPEVIRRYLEAHDNHDTEVALSAFASDATVVDEDREFQGSDGVRRFLETAGAGFTYTRRFVAAQQLDASTWLVENRLEGDFPGGVVDLRYQFRLSDDVISELVIAP